MLKGARALFDDQSGVICCENEDDPVVRALLVAHEIGHSEFHTGPAGCTTADIDPSRSTELPAIGLQRVADYGARERRELQADVFARELLLPRAFARILHIDENLSASEIADRTNLPVRLVWQQLFDALLLPPPSPSIERTPDPRSEHKLDQSQQTAVEHRGRAYLLQAGPGTGKTRTLVSRVISLLEEGTDPSSILILTFSNRAATELFERLMSIVPDATPKLWVGTFHAFGLDLLRRHHDKFGLPTNPSLFDRGDAIEVLEEILPTLPIVHYRNLWDPALVLRDVVQAISRAKDEMVGPQQYYELAAKMAAETSVGDETARIAAEKCTEIARIYRIYDEILREYSGVDFGDLVMKPAQLLAEDAAVRIGVQFRHRHVLVDEYQDVNRASARLLKEVVGNGERLWVVGDSRQSIYRFRGASADNMSRFSSDYDGAVESQLDVNYRSTAQIVDNYCAVASHLGASKKMLPLNLRAVRGEGPSPPEILRFETLNDEAEGIATSIRQLEKEGVRLREQAVLCRTNQRLNEISVTLENRGIPVLHLGSLFEREEVRDLLAVLSLAVDHIGDALIRVGAIPRYSLTLHDVRYVMQYLRTTENPVLQGLAESVRVRELSTRGRIGLELLISDLSGLSYHDNAWEFLASYLLDRTDLAKRMSRPSSVVESLRAVAVWQFLNFVREQSPVGSGVPIRRTLDRVRQLVLLSEDRDLRQVPPTALGIEAVRLMTIHGSKGLEFEAVHIPGLTVASLPSSNHGERCPPPKGMLDEDSVSSLKTVAKLAHQEEEECLFFVALSRARTYLHLYLARKSKNGRNRSPSPFINWLYNTKVREVEFRNDQARSIGATRSYQLTVNWPNDWTVTPESLSLYEKCPRRFLYTHVLGAGGARKSSAFSRTHECLYKFMHWSNSRRNIGELESEDAEKAFAAIWQANGPVEHAFAADYRKLASKLIQTLLKARAGQKYHPSKPIAIDLNNGRISVEPSEIAELTDGSVAIRRVRTGYKRSDEYDRLEYTLYQLAAQTEFGGDAIVQALHLTDETLERVSISSTKFANRRAKSDTLLSDIAIGEFPPKVDPTTCPRCPHFFICPSLPPGDLQLD